MHLFDYRIFFGQDVLLIDLDKTVVENAKRRQEAEDLGRLQRKEVDYWYFFHPDRLSLDRPMPDQPDLLWEVLDQHLVSTIAYLSSRPTFLWYATAEWLRAYAYPSPYQVLLRPQFKKTLEFKPEEVANVSKIARWVIVVDDESAVRNAVERAALTNVRVLSSIQALLGSRQEMRER